MSYEEFEAKHADLFKEINSFIPALMSKKRDIFVYAYLKPNAVMLPKKYNVPYEGPDEDEDFEGSLLGLPVVWGDRVGLVYEVEP